MTQPENFRFSLIKQTLMFQVKLGLDAIRDILLSPISIIFALLDLMLGHDKQQSYFLRLMRYGRMSDRWICLFGHAQDEPHHSDNNVDIWLVKAQNLIQEERKNGKLSASAKLKLEQYLAKVGTKNQSSNTGEPPADNE